MNSQVVLIPCDSYDEELIYQKLREGFALLGGVRACVGEAAHPLLKPNFLRDTAPEKATTTHPAVITAMARILTEEGYADLRCGDSCGFGSSKKIMKDHGLVPAFERYGVQMQGFEKAEFVDFPEGRHAKQFTVARDVLEADAIISLSKMKTHALEIITGAVKNQYGCVQGLHKAQGHTMYPSRESFARMLIDLNRFLAPRFFVMDGVVAMEGNGPASGDPVKMDLLLLSSDPVALDAVFCRLISLDPKVVPTCVFGQEMGLGTMAEEEIEVLTPAGTCTVAEAAEKYGKPDFDVQRKPGRVKGFMGLAMFTRIFQSKPRIREDLCRRCGICIESCPVEGKALAFRKGKSQPPVYNYRKCIKCFCCQELCPYQAIYAK